MCLQNKGHLIQCEAINLVNGRPKLNPFSPMKKEINNWVIVI